MHHLAIIRSLNTKNQDHGKGQIEMVTGQQPHAGHRLSTSRCRRRQNAHTVRQVPAPGHVLIRGGGSGSGQAAYLGPKYASILMDDGKPPKYTERLASLTAEADARRSAFRARRQ